MPHPFFSFVNISRIFESVCWIMIIVSRVRARDGRPSTIPFHLCPLAPPFGFPEILFRADERAKFAVLEVLRSLNCHFFVSFCFFAETTHWDLRTT